MLRPVGAGARAVLGGVVGALAPGLLALALGGPPASAEGAHSPSVERAELAVPTSRYGHNVLGGNEYAEMRVTVRDHGSEQRTTHSVVLPEDRVFEDIAARIADLDGDGAPEIVVVEASRATGAEIAVYGLRAGTDGADPELVRLTSTPPIGRAFRWRAVAAIGDLDGDGSPEIAEVDRPHLAGLLRVWALRDGSLVEIAAEPGFSNHRIGEDVITSALRDCGGGPELVLPDFAWSELEAVRLREGGLARRGLGLPASDRGMARALECEAP